MYSRRYRLVSVIAAFGLLVVVAVWLGGRPATDPSEALLLRAPAFTQTAYAESESVLAGIVDEAGIAGYYQTAGAITISNDLRNVFRTIEAETTTYIVGSVGVPSYPGNYDVHAYVNTAGWIMVYYLKADPAGKIIDWKAYEEGDKTSIVTVLEKGASIVAGAAGQPYTGLTYYDFRYPNANRLMLVAEAEDRNNGSEFTIQLPSTFTYYERSYSVRSRYYDDICILNGVRLPSSNDYNYDARLLSASQLLPDVFHTFSVRESYYCGLALVYREP